jgi:hypothetical protein
MRETNAGTSGADSWQRAAAAFLALFGAVRDLESDYPAARERLRRELHGDQQAAALFILRFMDADYTLACLDDLVAMSVSARHSQRISELLGMLPHADAANLVPPAVWRQLEASPDQETYLQLGSLLEHLGLCDALAELLNRSQASDDADIREAPDFFPVRGREGS